MTVPAIVSRELSVPSLPSLEALEAHAWWLQPHKLPLSVISRGPLPASVAAPRRHVCPDPLSLPACTILVGGEAKEGAVRRRVGIASAFLGSVAQVILRTILDRACISLGDALLLHQEWCDTYGRRRLMERTVVTALTRHCNSDGRDICPINLKRTALKQNEDYEIMMHVALYARYHGRNTRMALFLPARKKCPSPSWWCPVSILPYMQPAGCRHPHCSKGSVRAISVDWRKTPNNQGAT